MTYRVVNVRGMPIKKIVEKAVREEAGVIFDAREMLDSTRKIMKPTDISGIAWDSDVIYVDQLCFGDNMSMEASFLNSDEYEDMWMNLIRGWHKKLNIIILTGIKKKNGRDSLARKVSRKLRGY